MTKKSCAVGIRNAELGDHLNGRAKHKLSLQTLKNKGTNRVCKGIRQGRDPNLRPSRFWFAKFV